MGKLQVGQQLYYVPATMGSASLVRLLRLLSLTPLQLLLNGITNKLCAFLLADERVNTIRDIIPEPDKNWRYVQWWPSHTTRRIRYR